METKKPTYEELEQRLSNLENEYKQYKEIFNQFLKHSPFYVFIKDTEIRSIFLSHNYEKMLSRPLEDILGKTMDELFPSDFAKKMIADDIEILSNNKIIETEEEFNNRFYKTIKFPIHYDGKPQLLAGYTIDITEIKNTQNEIILAKEKAEKSEKKYRLIAENTSDGIIVLSKNNEIEYVSESYIKQLGYTEEEHLSRKMNDIYESLHIDDRDIVFAKIFKAIENKESNLIYSFRVKHKNGHYIWREDNAKFIYDENGNYLKAHVICRDVTERFKYQEELIDAKSKIEEKEKLYRLLAENSSDVIWIMDTNLNFTYLSPSNEKLFGYTSEERKNLPIEKMYSAQMLLKMKTSINEAIERYKKTKDNKPQIVELEGIHKDGHIINFEIAAKFIFDKNDVIIGMQGTSRDISERKKAEQTIRKLEKAIENSKISIVITDIDGKIEYANPYFSENSGYTKDEYLGQNPRILKTDYFDNEYYKTLWTTINLGNNWEGEFCNRKKNGTIYWEKVLISPIFNYKNEIINFVAIKTDITEVKKINEDLLIAIEKAKESDNLKSSFLNNISHEIRTPLNAIVGFSQLLKSPNLSVEKVSVFTNYITSSSDKLIEVINDVIEISQIHSNQTYVKECEFNIVKTIYDISSELKAEMAEKNLELIINLNPQIEIINIYSDNFKIAKILKHLISNAIKFTIKGSITIDFKMFNDKIEFSVTDTGIGISPKMQEEIFKPFRQAEIGNSRSYGGNGLGLAIVKGYTELLNGSISIISEPNVGTTFKIILPIKTNFEIKEDKIEINKHCKKLNTILIVDDEIFNQELIKEYLIDLSCNFLIANNGIEAIDFCRDNEKISLVLMDLKMPIMDGYTATKLIKAFRSDLPIIAQTAFANENQLESFWECGFDDYICKPLKINYLLDKISKFIK